MKHLAWLVVLLALQACATSSALQVAREQFRHGSAGEALQTLSEADVSNRDQLLLYFDRGMIAQAAGRYEDSILAFEGAINLIDELDYVSLRDQSASLLTNDWAKRYSGEYSEKLWVHTFQMLNYLLLGIPEGAAVEARRAVALFEEHSDLFKNDAFTRALMALSFETAGQINSAQVEYRKLAEDFSDFTLPTGKPEESELVLFIASGFIAPKLPGDLFIDLEARISFPYYAESFDSPPEIALQVDSAYIDPMRVDTSLVAISREALAQRGKSIAASQALRLGAKYSVAKAIEEKDALAGGIAKILLAVIEQADTRSWETLPENLSLVRIPLSAGEHTLSLLVNGFGVNTSFVEHQRTLEVDMARGERQFKFIRIGINPD